jgi:hypothetical protein
MLGLQFAPIACYPDEAVIRLVSIALASSWLALAIACASAAAASPSADDSRLLPSGSAAHLWLLPKSAPVAPSNLSSGACARSASARTLASPGSGDRASALRRVPEPMQVSQLGPQRRLPPRRASSDPPLAA